MDSVIKHNKIIGILGGAGPVATSYIFNKIIRTLQKEYGAKQDQDFPALMIYSLPLNDFTETGFITMKTSDTIFDQLLTGIKKLEETGCELIVITCNTTHFFYDMLQKSVHVPVINLIDETSHVAKSNGINRALVLSSRSTRDLGLYSKALSEIGLDCINITDTEQTELDTIILNIMGGTQSNKDITLMEEMLGKYSKLGADGLIVGCTEISVIIDTINSPITIVDSAETAVRKVINHSRII